MSDDGRLGLVGAASIALGGMIGGGVFAVLGVVAQIAGAAAWLSFSGACLVSAAAAYSYLRLNELSDRRGGSVTQIQAFTGNGAVAGVVGWTLLFGYLGAIAMYAFAFGSFAVELLGTTHSLARPVASVVGIGLFVGLNVLGTRASGISETALVAVKLLVLLVFGLWGFYYGNRTGSLDFGLGRLTSVGPYYALAVSFVSFQGWQLLMYDQEAIANPREILPKAIYLSITVTVVVDGLIAIVVTSLAPTEVILQNPETALAVAAEPFMGQVGFTLVSAAAIFSTGSAVNGTLFSAAYFTKGMIGDGLFPDAVGRAGTDGVPTRTVVVLGTVAAGFAAVGSLQGITSFGSLAFMAVFGAMSYLAFRERDGYVSTVVPAVGVVGTSILFPVLLYHLATNEPGTFTTVVLAAVAVVSLELLYFERETIRDGFHAVEERIES
ncbi:amino acid permease [Halosegnis longus]|uniref:amino acid permease n=1 Tax=Halosegnis longus TaxID=2216012 RepID=UPI00096AC643|nr:APC family permease [Salella cibi]